MGDADLSQLREYTPSQDQLRFWLLDRLTPTPYTYNLAIGGHVRGALEPELFRTAALALAERHDALRTVFVDGDEGPLARVLSTLPPSVRVVDASAWDAAVLDAELDRFRREPFALASGSPLRVGLFVTGWESAILLMVVHHIASDFAALEVLMEDLGGIYLAAAGGAPESVPPPPPGFAAAAAAEPGAADERTAQASETYWKAQVASPPPSLSWQFPPGAGGLSDASHFFAMDGALVEAVKRYALQRRVTPSAVLLGAWSLLLARLTGEPDCLVGVPMSTRGPAFARTIGCFINTLPIRVAAPANGGLEAATLSAWQALVGAVRHRRYPLNRIVRAAEVVREPGRNPLFQTMLILQRPSGPQALGALHLATEARSLAIPWAGVVLTPRRLVQQEGQVDLSLEANDTEGCFQCVLKAQCERVPAGELPVIAGALQEILAQGVGA